MSEEPEHKLQEESTLVEEIASIVANTRYSFAAVGELNLPQFRALQKALVEKVKMTNIALLGGMFGGSGSASKGNKTTLTPNQFDELVQQKKAQLGKNVLSLNEVI